jgi:hypothetical protein
MINKLIIFKIKLLIFLYFGSTLVNAQTLGTYRLNISPFCNVISLTITQLEAGLSATGSDDNCGLEEASPVTGSFSSAGMGPGPAVKGILISEGSDRSSTVSTTVRIFLGDFDGDWVDEAGNQGFIIFNPTTAPSGQPRIAQKNMSFYVTPDGILVPPHSNKGATVTHPATGEYCIVIPKRSSVVGTQATSADLNNRTNIVTVAVSLGIQGVAGTACSPLITDTNDVIPVFITKPDGTPIDGYFSVFVP